MEAERCEKVCTAATETLTSIDAVAPAVACEGATPTALTLTAMGGFLFIGDATPMITVDGVPLEGRERDAVHVLEDETEFSFVGDDIERRNDVGMHDARGDARLIDLLPGPPVLVRF